MRITFIVIAFATLLSACSPLRLLNVVVPSGDYQRIADISYGSTARQKLDIYKPNTTTRAAPVVIFFYGGSWQNGSKDDYRFVAEALTSRGYVVAIADYRVYPEVRYPAFLEDSAAVAKWTLDHVREYGGDTGRLYLMGHSAGAYNAAMLLFDRRYLKQQGMTPDNFRGFIGLAGPYDFLPLTSPNVKAVFSTAADLNTTQPINYVRGGEPPVLLLTANKDSTVDPDNSTRLADRIRKYGGKATEIRYDGLDHARVLLVLAAPFRGWAPVLQDIADFIGH